MLKQFVKNQDNFGSPIYLNLNGETEVKTFVGGLASIISKVIILIFMAFKLQAIYEQQATSKFLFVMSNVITKPNDYVFSKKEMQFAVQLNNG